MQSYLPTCMCTVYVYLVSVAQALKTEQWNFNKGGSMCGGHFHLIFLNTSFLSLCFSLSLCLYSHSLWPNEKIRKYGNSRSLPAMVSETKRKRWLWVEKVIIWVILYIENWYPTELNPRECDYIIWPFVMSWWDWIGHTICSGGWIFFLSINLHEW